MVEQPDVWVKRLCPSRYISDYSHPSLFMGSYFAVSQIQRFFQRIKIKKFPEISKTL